MRVLHVVSEIFPLVKTGGLADVAAALPAALMSLDIDVRVLLPGYPQAIDRLLRTREVARISNMLNTECVRLVEGLSPASGIPVLLVDCPALYRRPGGPYQDDDGIEWRDNAVRFALLNHVAAAIANGTAGLPWRPDVVHAHDWHTGLLPLLLHANRGARPQTLFTIHNLAYQGTFAAEEFPKTGLPTDAYLLLEFYGRISFLKAGILRADALTTVSKTYAREILTPEFGCALDGLLRKRATCLTGIPNGADYQVWDPAHDPHLTQQYSLRTLSAKQACKKAIREELGLDADAEAPLIAYTSRLAHQKMPDTMLEALPGLLEDSIQFALVAEGDRGYESQFRELASRYPGQVSVRIGYEEPLAHRLMAGADMLAHPSRFEPCGLAPVYALRYGTIPIVRRVGGTADTVVDATLDNIHAGAATGFLFDQPTHGDLVTCIERAISLYRQPLLWRKIQSSAMQQDFGWERSALAYAELYRSLAPAEIRPPRRHRGEAIRQIA